MILSQQRLFQCGHFKWGKKERSTVSPELTLAHAEVRHRFQYSLLQGNKAWVSETVGFYGNGAQDWVNVKKKKEKKGLFLSITTGVFWVRHMLGLMFYTQIFFL